MSRKFTEKEKLEICKVIFANMTEGISLRKSAIEANISPSSAMDWIDELNLGEQYARANNELMLFWADQVVDIADDSKNDYIETESGFRPNTELVARSRLRIDSRKWILSKLAPKKYGDKLDLSSSDGTMSPPTVIKIQEA